MTSVKVDFDDGPWIDPLFGAVQHGRVLFLRKKLTKADKRDYPDAKQEDFIYGKGCMGVGYYSFHTKDAHRLLLTGLQRSHAIAKSSYDSFDCNNCLCFGSTPSAKQLGKKNKLYDRVQELAIMVAYTKARLESAGPNVELAKEAIAKHYMTLSTVPNRSSSSSTRGETYTDNTAASILLMPMMISTPELVQNANWGSHGGGGGGGGGCGG
jgi:hypothetical protein